jgi:hypothetical protein
MESQYGRLVGRKRLVDRFGSKYYTYMYVNKRLAKIGSEGE